MSAARTARKPAETRTDETSLRERILNAAFSAFMEHGYAGTSTLEIATRAKVSKRDVYAEFGSKQEMLAVCIASRAQRMRRPLDMPPVETRRQLVAALETYGETMLREWSDASVLAVYRLAIAEADRSPGVARALDAVREATSTALAALLQGAQAKGLIGPGDPREIGMRFGAILWRGDLRVRLLLRLADPPSPQDARDRARSATDAVLALYPAKSV